MCLFIHCLSYRTGETLSTAIFYHIHTREERVLQWRSQQVSTLFPAWFQTACVVLDQPVAFCACLLYAPRHTCPSHPTTFVCWFSFWRERWQSKEENCPAKRSGCSRAISLQIVWVLHAVTSDGCITALLQQQQPVQQSTFLFPKVKERRRENHSRT